MKHDLTTRKYERRARKLYALFSCLVLALTVMVVPAFAADDPLTTVSVSSAAKAGTTITVSATTRHAKRASSVHDRRPDFREGR